MLKRHTSFVLAVLVFCTVPLLADGGITGRVVDGQGNPLPGARVSVSGSQRTATVSSDGNFTLKGIPAGAVVLTTDYLGLESTETNVDVVDGEVRRVEIALENALFAESVTVSGDWQLQGQARALNPQKNAVNIKSIVASDQIGRFPDPNAAEAAQRIPGIALQRDQGEGRYVSIRGASPGDSSVQINGIRLPSPEGDGRDVALDVIPADLMEAIEVSKAVTPDMDADAIGGVINLITKVAPENSRLSLTGGIGENDLMDDGIVRGSVTYGGRFDESRTGLVVTGSAFETDRGSDNFEAQYDDGNLAELDLRDYTITRERYGLTAGLDRRVNDGTELRWNGIYNEFGDQEFRRRVTNNVSDGEVERELKDRYEEQQILSTTFGGNTLIGGRTLLEYRFAYSEAEEYEPGRFDTNFIQEDIEFFTNVTPNSIDPNNIRADALNEDPDGFELDDITREDNLTTDEEISLQADLSLPLGDGGIWKFGVKGRFKEKARNIEVNVFEADDVNLADFRDNGFVNPSPFFEGRYDLGQVIDPSTPRTLISDLGLEAEKDIEEDLADYESSEDVLAAYAMAQAVVADRFTLTGGLRVEQTDTDYTSFELVFDEDGEFAGTTPQRGSNDSTELLPSVNLIYEIDGQSNFRAAASRTMSRPRFADLVPFQLLIQEDNEIERGNPDLDFTTSTNLDLLYERYFTTVGVFTAGVFYKDISDNVFLATSQEIRGGDVFEVTQPVNGAGGEITGFEFSFQNRFRSLPAPFDGLGVYANATIIDSEAQYFDRPDTRLPGQADEVLNFAVSYEKAGFSGRITYNYTSDWILEVGGGPQQDQIVDDHGQLDLSFRQSFTDRFSLILDVINANDEEYRVFEGDSLRTIQDEFYGWSATLSARLEIR